MFGGGMPSDNSAEIARKQAMARESRVGEGRQSIDQAFTQFDDPYFANQQQQFSDFYMPQVEDQFKAARRGLTLDLARSGNLNSGAGARQLAGLEGKYRDTRTQYADQAMDYSNQRRSDVENERNKLYQYNMSAADPSAVGSAVQAGVGSLGVQPSFSPLGALFQDFASNANTAIKTKRYRDQQGGANIYDHSNSASVIG
jgi:hypothetical protein